MRITNADGTVTEQHFAPEKGSVTLEPDVREYFPDSESVNRTLRSIIAIIPKKRHAKKAS
ncbi:MAG: hypothetical protein M1133_01500 [Armatimonadetes bacterium]|nr:hypothetical protein [Armatimonadota bacterium]